MRGKDYDAAAAARGSIPVRIGRLDLDFPGDVPVDVAMEWYERQTVTAKALGETPGEYAKANYRLVISTAATTDEILDAVDALSDDPRYAGVEDLGIFDVLATRVGQRTVDDLYKDLLDAWGLLPRPKEQDVVQRQLVGRLRVELRRDRDRFDPEKALRLLDELGLLLGYPAGETIEVEETDATVGGDPGNA